jgi:hypothetical protein
MSLVSPDRLSGSKITHILCLVSRTPLENTNDQNSVSTNANASNIQDENIDNTVDPFQGIDWSTILDDFGWIGEGPVFLGPA